MEAAQELVDEAAERKFRNSKARDADGKLMKVYHGTESDVFYEFDKNRRGQTDSSLWGRGYYFSSDIEFAEDFGDNVQSFYLNITNPFTVSLYTKQKRPELLFRSFGDPSEIRTPDTLIKSQVLCQLS